MENKRGPKDEPCGTPFDMLTTTHLAAALERNVCALVLKRHKEALCAVDG